MKTVVDKETEMTFKEEEKEMQKVYLFPKVK
jgi:hypothetical protein